MSGATTAAELNELRKQHADPGSASRNGFAKLMASSSEKLETCLGASHNLGTS